MRFWVLFLLLLATPAWGQAWSEKCDGTGAVEKVHPTNARQACYTYTGTGVTDSGWLDTIECDVLTIAHIKTSSSDASTLWLLGGDGTGTADNDFKILMDTDGGGVDNQVSNGDVGGNEDGDATAENRSLFWNVGPIPELKVDVVVAPGAAQRLKVLVVCGKARS